MWYLARYSLTSKRSPRGFTLVELLVGLVAGAAMLWLAGLVVSSVMKSKKAAMIKESREADLATLMTHILRVGRLAESCTSTLGLKGSLTCKVKRLADGPSVDVRFITDGDSAPYKVLYQEDRGSGLDANTIATYPNIKSLSFCSDVEIGNCPWGPARMNARQVVNQKGYEKPPNRFFRVELIYLKTLGTTQTMDIAYHTAFFVRNPTPYVTANYVWGAIE